MTCARMLGAEEVIAIDRFPERLQLAATHGGAVCLNYEEVDVADAAARAHGRARSGCLHRRGRPGGTQ